MDEVIPRIPRHPGVTYSVDTEGWLVYNGTFSTKRLHRAIRKVKVSDKK